MFYHNNEKPLNIDCEFWDKEKKVLKYKYEKEPILLRNEIIFYCEDKLDFKNSIYEDYKKEDIYKDENYNNIVNEIIASNKGSLILGPAGTGKSFLIKKLSKLLQESGKTILKLAPTNKSARIIEGQTLDKYSYKILQNKNGLNKAKKYDYIFIDKVSMVRETFYKVMIMIKNAKLNMKFIISGDFFQLSPVNDTIQNRSYKNSRVLYELVDGMKINLTLCKRSDAELFNLCEDVKCHKDIDITGFNKKLCWVNICHTNKKRKEINEIMLKEFYRLNKTGRKLKVEKLNFDENSQEYLLMRGMPLIARRNNKKLNIYNNEMFTCHSIKKETIIVKNEMDEEIEIPFNSIKYFFHIGFCITTHKSQGETYNEDYAIYEWEQMSYTLKYVALSRGTNKNIINIC